MAHRLEKWKEFLASEGVDIDKVQVPDLRAGGFERFPLAGGGLGFYNVQSLDEFLGNVNYVLGIKDRKVRISQREAEELTRGMRRCNPYQTLEEDVNGVYNMLQKRLEGKSPEEANRLVAEFLLRKLDIGENFGVRIVGDSERFLYGLHDKLKRSDLFREAYSIGDIRDDTSFRLDCHSTRDFEKGHVSFRSYEDIPTNHVESSYHGEAILCAYWLNDMARFMNQEKIPGRFAMVKGDDPGSPWLNWVFYDPAD